MRVLVTGGRNYSDRATVFATLDRLDNEHCIDCVIHGKARGADALAGNWAYVRGVPCDEYPATGPWPAAGPIRNARMANEGRAGLCVSFPGGRGTADMIEGARRVGIPVLEVATSPPVQAPVQQPQI